MQPEGMLFVTRVLIISPVMFLIRLISNINNNQLHFDRPSVCPSKKEAQSERTLPVYFIDGHDHFHQVCRGTSLWLAVQTCSKHYKASAPAHTSNAVHNDIFI